MKNENGINQHKNDLERLRYQRNKEQINARRKELYNLNKEKLSVYRKQKRLENLDEVRLKQRIADVKHYYNAVKPTRQAESRIKDLVKKEIGVDNLPKKNIDLNDPKIQKLLDKAIEDKPKVKKSKETLDLNNPLIQELIQLVKDKNKDKETQEEDPIIKLVDKYGKYVPLILSFIEGFKNRRQDSLSQSGNVIKLQAPPGWNEMKPLDKLSKKYSNPDWYQAGLRYDEAIESQGLVQYSQPTQQTQYAPPIQQQPRSISELAQKYDDNSYPLVNDDVPKESDKNVQENEGKDTNNNIENNDKNIEDNKQNIQDKEKIIKEIEVATMQDNLKYIGIAVQYINNIPNEQLVEKLKDTDSLVSILEPFKIFLPFSVIGMIKNTPYTDWVQVFKEQCPEKYKLIEENNLVSNLEEFFKKIPTKL